MSFYTVTALFSPYFFTIVFTPYLSLVRTTRRVADKMYTLFKMHSHKKVLFRCKEMQKNTNPSY